MIWTYTKNFSWKEMTRICQVLEGKKFQIFKFLCHYCQAQDGRCILWRNPWWVLGMTAFVGPDRDYGIGSNFWKFYLIRTVFWWKCLNCLDWNRLFWCSECEHNEFYNILSIGKTNMFVMPCTWSVCPTICWPPNGQRVKCVPNASNPCSHSYVRKLDAEGLIKLNKKHNAKVKI
jgi:hypothetical protein